MTKKKNLDIDVVKADYDDCILTTQEIADKHNCSATTILSQLKSIGHTIIKQKERKSRIFVNKKQLDYVVIKDQYESGLDTKELAKIHGIFPDTILRILRSMDVHIRTSAEAHTLKLDKDVIISQYQSGMNYDEIAVIHKCGSSTIGLIIDRSGIDKRVLGEIKYIDVPVDTIRSMYYDQELSCNEIGKFFGVSKGVISQYIDDKRSISDAKKASHKNHPEIGERHSASQQGIPHEDWIGYIDKNRPHLIPKNGCLHLNPKFKGCNQHHITTGVIINIPTNLHKSIWHSMPHDNREGKNMKEINELAYNYLMGNI